MLRKIATILLVANMTMLDYSNANFVKYKKYLNKKIVDENLTVSSADPTFQTRNLVVCTVKCNLVSDCEMVSYDDQNRCTMFTNQTVIVDLHPSASTNVYSKNPIESCLNDDFYADMNQMSCLRRKSAGVGCDNKDQCMKGLECADYICACIPPSENYWSANDKTCLPLKTKNNDICTEVNECSALHGLDCIEGLCECADSFNTYWSDTEGICLPKKLLGGDCAANVECSWFDALTVCLNGKCDCFDLNEFYKHENTCRLRQKAHQECETNGECLEIRGLTCQSGICECEISENFWSRYDSSYLRDKCEAKQTYGQTCNVTEGCLETKGLNCRQHKCQCPLLENWSLDEDMCIPEPITGSRILWQTDQMDSLKELIGFQSKSLELLYRATRDGFDSLAFHHKCDGIAGTLTIIRETSGYVFGGFASVAWQSIGEYVTDTEAFLFTLTNPSNTPLKLPIKPGGIDALYFERSYGPTFGAGHDINVRTDSNTNTNSYISSSSYESPNGEIGKDAGKFFKGESSDNLFTTVEVEVFRVYNFDSAILTDGRKTALKNLISFESKSFELIYRASRDGFWDETFHSNCDNVSNTVTIVKEVTNGYTFGGFTSVPWTSNSVYSTDTEAFLFTLLNPSNTPLKLPIRPEAVSKAISQSGPIKFGEDGNDLKIRHQSFTANNLSFIRPGDVYEGPNGLTGVDAATFIKGGMDIFFQTIDVEVFAVGGFDSSILTIRDQQILTNLIGFQNNKTFALIYRASQAGFDASVFHQRCDGITNTLTIVKETNGYVFGGFTSVAWQLNSGYIKDSEAFIFTLLNPSNTPLKLPIGSLQTGDAIYTHPNYGPTFGAGHDLTVYTDSNINTNSCVNVQTYVDKSKNKIQGTNAGIFFKGGSDNLFRAIEVEVFKVFHFESTILSDANKVSLKNLIGFELRHFDLIYRGSRDGFSATAFHQICDAVANTITVVKDTDGYVFGAFTSREFSSVEGYYEDYEGFLFTLLNPSKTPAKLAVNPDRRAYSHYNRYNWGPTFGEGLEEGFNELHISSDANANRLSYIRPSHSNTFEGFRDLTAFETGIFIKGGTDEYFQPVEVEVFKVQ